MDAIAEIVGDNIRIEREALGLSQADLAEAIHVKPQTVYRWEKGRVWPTARNISSLAKLFGVDPTTLFTRRKPLEAPKLKSEDPKLKAALTAVCRYLGYNLTPAKAGRRA